MFYEKHVEKWGIFEVRLNSRIQVENPFSDVSISAVFKTGSIEKKVNGFYDGDDTWIVRFMPEETGKYTFKIKSDIPDFDNQTGEFECVPPSKNNHGPVKVNKTFHFSYADGMPFFVMGTTAYSWTTRPREIRAKTLESIKKYNFNKIRMFFPPKYYWDIDEGEGETFEPDFFPFEGEPNNFNFRKFNPEYFRNYENCVKDLMDIGAEADIILFHFYDNGKYGIDKMSEDDALFFLKYIISRMAAYRNVWWSLANEYDLLYEAEKRTDKRKVVTDLRNWDVIGEFIKANDSYGHLRSIHNLPFGVIYPDRQWMTHVSYQHPNTYSLMMDLKKEYQKPVINDEYQYEGNIKYDWGNNTPEDELYSHWLATMAGGYATHGEVYVEENNDKDNFVIFGGEISGGSAPRLKYMKEILESCPFQDLTPDWRNTDGINYFSLSKGTDFFLLFFRNSKPDKVIAVGYGLVSDYKYKTEIFDVWNCKKVDEFIANECYDIKITEWTAVKMTKLNEG